MNNATRKAAVVATLLTVIAVSGCGSAGVESTAWLLIVAEDTMTVGDLGDAWTGMDQDQRDMFLEKENTVGEFIVTYGRKLLLQMELQDCGYMDDEELLSMADSWVMERTGEVNRRLMYESQEDAVSPEDIDHFMIYLGKYAFFTMDPGLEEEISYGPVHMPSLPDDMIGLLDSLAAGSTGISETGMMLRLDSVQTADSVTMATIFADSVTLRANIVSSIANKRYNEEYEDLRASLLSEYGLSIDSTVLETISASFASDSPLTDLEAVVMESQVGTWTVEDFLRELVYYRSKYNIDPSDVLWLNTLLELLHYNEYARSSMMDQHQDVLDSLYSERMSYLLDIASDKFYADRIESAVTVTEEDMRELFENMEEPITIPEKRVLQAIQMPLDSAIVFRNLPEDQQDAYLLRMRGFANLAADTAQSQITRPLRFSEVPGFHGEEVFAMDPSDTTTWLGPLELFGGEDVCMFRLVEVIPERNATLEEVKDQIRTMTRNRMEEQATVEELRLLEERYGMVINEEILDLLPADPGLWAGL
ncbi:MAG: hypothetical protein JXA64_00345 [Candidatus Fermentibacteraceae bacterium]|nr:hypothetical protein [Candidatus Fermentibacteraceae bacterium]MBN2607534.1 hypothetical protein [Candidatus Fermentibacteraceae bacterium]